MQVGNGPQGFRVYVNGSGICSQSKAACNGCACSILLLVHIALCLRHLESTGIHTQRLARELRHLVNTLAEVGTVR